ncbi:alpha/beta fold hydrolase ['Paenibacillus yunnanensis' Narsing Rao et al. 2020]|uniref:alpha/beta fold hydrolase n=1 Tax=Paenibacillus tengchongensis TaxID=2608684 RepID=UPI00124EF66F|nr:alpha/beta hydrolase [Paenibacillus tengchongensis]
MGKYIEVESNVKLYVEDIGSGTPVIFIHGWPLNHKMFEYQFIDLAEKGFRCIGIDLRGFGKSDAPWEGYSYERQADDIRAVIDALNLHNAVLVGFSIGGAIAAKYMARHAGYGITKLLLVGAATPSFVQRSDFAFGSPEVVVNNLIISTHLDRPDMVTDLGMKFFAKKGSASFTAWFASLGMEASAQGTLKDAASLRDEDLRADLPLIHVPTAIFHGTQDKIVPFELAEQTQLLIPGSLLVPFDESGHGLLFDEPRKFNDSLYQFISM